MSFVRRLWHCVNRYLNAPEVVTLADDQLINFISSTWLLLNLLIPVETVRVYLVFCFFVEFNRVL